MVDIIDGGTYKRSATYTGPGTIDANCRNAQGVNNRLTGDFTGSGNAAQILVGFAPRHIKVINETDGIVYETHVGMAAANSIKFVLGGSLAGTLDTSSAIVRTDGGAGNWTVTLAAAVAINAKHIVFVIEGD